MSGRVRSWRESRSGVPRKLWEVTLCVAVLLLVGRIAASVPSQQVQVSYDVEFTTSPTVGAVPGQCPQARGFDKMVGTITGFEPAPAHDDNVYTGKFTRTTDFTFCGVADNPAKPGEHMVCVATITAGGEAWFEFTLYADARGAYLKWMDDKPVRVTSSAVAGNCDAPEQNDWKLSYGDMSTAGSPDGQPINVTAMPRIGPFPKVFPPMLAGTPAGRSGPSAGDIGIWTMTVKGRRP